MGVEFGAKGDNDVGVECRLTKKGKQFFARLIQTSKGIDTAEE